MNVDKKEILPITERIKTFEDACIEIGKDHPFFRSYNGYASNIHEDNKNDTDILAYLKLRIICAALNEGWIPRFTKGELLWFPYFIFYTQNEIDRMPDEKEKQLCLWGGPALYGSYCGCACSRSDGAFSYVCAAYGSRLVLCTKDLAEYCGRQFIELWVDLYNIKKTKIK